MNGEIRTMLDEVLTLSLQNEGAKFSRIDLADIADVSDASLVTASIDGSDRAFAEIFDRHKSTVARVIGKFFRERTDVEEFVQQAFVKAYFSLKSFKGSEDGAFAAWMVRIAVNVCYDEFRRRQRKGEQFRVEISDPEMDYLETLADGRQPTPESRMVAAQLVEKLTAGLSEADRVAMVMVYCGEYSLDEVAGALGIGRAKLKSRLFRCRQQLKERFQKLYRY
jgi:RNA polymerase sigma-70 factor, ECF subfamily